jgi:flavin-dependent dehydrogenase
VRRADVIVIGAGPAGCAAACVLAQCGHLVTLVDRPPGTHHAMAESIPPSANRILTELGMATAVGRAGFQPWLGNTVWWAGAPPRTETFAADATGYQVERERFDGVLRDVAVSAGAQLVAGPVPDVSVGRGLPWVLDCSGRAGVIAARQGLRVPEPSHRTIALAGVWRAVSPWPASQAGHTLVASHADGWAWSVPVAPDVRYVTVMVDPERSHLTRGASALDVYQAELKKVGPFAEVIAQARLKEGPWGADASLYSARQHAGTGFLLVGDAATFIDPLSSFGVKKALASGWLAGVVVNTVLHQPAMEGEALAFFERREREVAESFRKKAARFAVNATEDSGHPFWDARAERAGSEDPASEEQDVRAALADLRARREIHLERGAQVQIAPRAVIRGRLIVMEDHVCLPAWPGGVRYIRNVNVLLVMRLAEAHRDVGELFAALVRIQPGVTLPDFLAMLATLLARGGLQHKM